MTRAISVMVVLFCLLASTAWTSAPLQKIKNQTAKEHPTANFAEKFDKICRKSEVIRAAANLLKQRRRTAQDVIVKSKVETEGTPRRWQHVVVRLTVQLDDHGEVKLRKIKDESGGISYEPLSPTAELLTELGIPDVESLEKFVGDAMVSEQPYRFQK